MPEISDELVDKLEAIASAITAFLHTMKQPNDRLSDDVAATVRDLVLRGLCLQGKEELAGEERVTRGLCGKCYNRTMQRIARGKESDAWFVANGLMLAEKKKGGRKASGLDPAAALLAEADAAVDDAVDEGKKIGRSGGDKKKKPKKHRDSK
jgi:hypothetical protein